MAKYLDESGFQYAWGKIKAWAKRLLVNNITYDGQDKAIKMTKSNGANDAEVTTTVVSASTIVTDGGGITQHQDISGKADKAIPAAAGNVATLNASGNLTDSGKTIGTSVPSDAVFTDTKNTAGATDSNNKLYIVGATSQADNPQTYSQDTAYVGTDGHLYSDGKQTVNLSGTQALTNKTYNGYTLGAACEKGVDVSISSGSTSTNVPTVAAVEARITQAIQSAQVGAAMFKGTVNAGTDISNMTAYSKGWYWVVATAGTYVGQTCEVGDMIYCVEDFSTSYDADDFSVVQNNITSITTAEIDSITSN